MAFEVTIKGIHLTLLTSEQVFSPQHVDLGTQAMLSQVVFAPEDRVLDLGCGYGVVGILAAKLIGSKRVMLVDVDPEALRLSRLNAHQNDVGDLTILLSDGFNNVTADNFTLILSNPPYHEDFSVPKGFIEGGFARLALGGKLIMVVKRLDWYKNKISSVFGGVTIKEVNDYYVLIAEKRSATQPVLRTEKLVSRKHAKREERASRFKKKHKQL